MSMLEDKRFTRRTFVKGSGALVVGFSLAGAATAGRASAGSARGQIVGPPDANAVDSYLEINADNTVTLKIGKVELGQGAPTGLLMIAAEELDMDLSQFHIVRHDTNVTPQQGATVGSASIRRGGVQVRQAAAAARATLLGLASAKLGVPVGALSVSKGVVSGGGKSVTYGELVGGHLFNVKMTGKEQVKKPSDYKVVGTRVPRIDIPDKVSGKYTYMQNVRVPGMLHGRIVRPKGQGAYGTGAKPLSIDASSIRHIKGAQIVRKGDFVGVVAPHEFGAIQAASQLKVKWQETPILPGNGDLFGQIRSHETQDVVRVNAGNADSGLAKATKVVSASFNHNYQMHASMGPVCAIADVKSGSATVLCSSQDIYGVRRKVSAALGVPESAVRVQFYEGSGCYGHNPQDDVAQAAAIMSQAAGRPVRVQFMRWDEHGWDNYGPAQVTDVRAGIDDKGNIVAYDYQARMVPYFSTETSDEVAGVAPAPPTGLVFAEYFNMAGQYAVANRKVTTKGLPLTKGYFKTTFLRAPSAPQSLFASEQVIDELAYAAGMDPVAFRRQNISKDDDRWGVVLDAVTKLSKWQPRTANSVRQTGTIRTGRGIALGGFADSPTGVVAEIQVNMKTGKITATHVYGAQDQGLAINPALVESQMEGSIMQGVSRALLEEVKFDKKRVTSLDWATYPALRFKDAPKVTVLPVQRMDRPSTGSGEPTLAPVAAAIANAFFDATGVRVRQAPMTPGVVRAALKAKA
ncbi:MAG TPA: molybdopterin cofactor-binding domain-containing protein [Gaiellaceae bacterium]